MQREAFDLERIFILMDWIRIRGIDEG